MPEEYSVQHLTSVEPEWIEQMGSKPKFWFRQSGDDQPWLFKFAREGTGEDWAEKIAAELARVLQVPCAGIELAEFSGRRGSISRSFVLQSEGWGLLHGNELLANYVSDYQPELVFRQSEHTLENILTVLRQLFCDSQQAQAQIAQLATLLWMR